jgi:hypothetical protein
MVSPLISHGGRDAGEELAAQVPAFSSWAGLVHSVARGRSIKGVLTDTGKRERIYRADFVYVDNALGITVVEDRKGHETDVFKIKKAILAAQGMEILVTRTKG